jgi:hypothetical protein
MGTRMLVSLSFRYNAPSAADRLALGNINQIIKKLLEFMGSPRAKMLGMQRSIKG